MYKSLVIGTLIVKGKLMNYGDLVELTDVEIYNKPELRKLVVTNQLVRVYV